jgi:hypothetical protein
MKKIALAALAVSAAMATPAAAQSANATGTVNITGSVASKCFVLPNNAGNTFGTTVAMGELAKADGTLKDSSVLSSTFGTVGSSGLTAQVLCTSATPAVSVTAEPLVNSATADAGYDNTVDYTADVTFTQVVGSTVVNDPSAVPAASTATLSGRLNGSGTNVAVATSGWTASGVLVSGDYTGKITIVISPGA